jgi:hypothetical protein
MPLRGSVQFLLLSLRPRATLGLGFGVAAVGLLLVSLIPLKEDFPLFEKTGVPQALRQSVWDRALSGQSGAERWPWEDVSVNMSLAPGAAVPRLGLSATLLKQDADGTPAAAKPHRVAGVRAHKPAAAQGDIALGDAPGGVKIGDSITFTAADGAICVYRVTGHRVVDPHIAETELGPVDGTVALFDGGELEDLIQQATQGAQGEPKAQPHPAGDQQKL